MRSHHGLAVDEAHRPTGIACMSGRQTNTRQHAKAAGRGVADLPGAEDARRLWRVRHTCLWPGRRVTRRMTLPAIGLLDRPSPTAPNACLQGGQSSVHWQLAALHVASDCASSWQQRHLARSRALASAGRLPLLTHEQIYRSQTPGMSQSASSNATQSVRKQRPNQLLAVARSL
jgi:hypothetical protein